MRSGLNVVLLIAVALGGPVRAKAPPTPQEQAKKAHKEAKKALRTKDFARAYELFERADQLVPHARYVAEMAWARFKQKRLSDAHRLAKLAVTRPGLDADIQTRIESLEEELGSAWWEEADEAVRAKDFDRAYKLLERVNQLVPHPLYLTNMAKVRYEQGRLSDAHRLYALALTRPGLDDPTRAATQRDIKDLEGRLASAWLDLSEVPTARRLQLDQRMLEDRSEMFKMTPGHHLLCLHQKKGRVVRCAWREFQAGRRYRVPLKRTTSGAMLWEPQETIAELRIQQRALLVDLALLRRLEVDVGVYTVEAQTSGGLAETFQVKVLDEADVPLAPRIEGWLGRESAKLSAIDPVPWAVTGAGVVLTGIAAGLLLSSAATRADINNPKLDEFNISTMSQREASQDWAASVDITTAGWVTLGVGVAVTIGGAVWGIIDVLDAGERRVVVAPSRCGIDGGCSVVVGGRF